MSALAEALVAAQRRALAAVEKQYAAGKLEADAVREKLTAIGLTDDVDADRLLAALDLIREYGAALPAEPTPNGEPRKPETMTAAQGAYIDKLWSERGGKPGDKPITTGLTKADASRLIEQLKTDTYNVADWDIPF